MTAEGLAQLTDISPDLVEQRSFVDGAWLQLDENGRYLTNPNTGEPRQPMRKTGRADVEHALAAAASLHESGKLEDIKLRDRLELLTKIAASLDAQSEEIALQDSINTGVPIRTTRLIAGALGDRVRGTIAEAEELGESETLDGGDRSVVILRKPLGPALIVGPWNAPTFTVVGKVAAAMAAGCPVILKPSENAPGGCQLFAESIAAAMTELDYPSAAFQLVHGNSETGSLLTSDPRIEALSFTGGDSAGRTVAQAAASNLAVMQMELGSNNPVIILDDADVSSAAQSILQGMTRLNGQWCEAPGKVLVDGSIHDRFVEAMKFELSKLRVGNALDETTEVGPLAFERQRDGLKAAVNRLLELGGTLVTGGDLPDLNGWFLAPGMIVGCPAGAATEELFGPLVTVHPVHSVEEALSHANGPATGLDAYVFGGDETRAIDVASRIRAGEVRINGTFMSDLAGNSRQSFWGTSGIGGHGPQYGVRFFTGDRVVGVDRTDFPL
ncbi:MULTISPECIES: aldehyde dehydrogenase family protein [Arthrobacter]|uniref:aldehyde dehydrogenase family protein n=1 Tax=Arthrobacter TaxID=1663 RepID=UPI00254B97D5|nr:MULTISPECIES: aldehyde dehydrogenase family protein [Arthrobacter]MDQ0212190.1 phenylacetaldehyde dehydrogenase [Arthrobacter bambusae]MDQ0236591.1 phenylacetaldehyde dehydrogenase [Arthrobacter bambusae]